MVAVPVVGEAPKKDTRYWTEWYLENWARVSQMKGLALGLPKQAAVGENYTSLDLDGDHAYDRMCYDAADVTELIVKKLPPAEAMAIRHRYLGETYNPREVGKFYDLALAAALPMVTDGLRRRGQWLGD